MPLTWFAHQAPAIGMKLARPAWFDATALCVGSMMPDLMYTFSSYVHIDTHQWPSAFTYGVPLTVAVAMITRFVAPVVANQLPDLGPFRLHSFAVLSRRRPALWLTLVCAVLGIGSHIVLDWFTHPGRPGTRWLGYDDVVVHVAGRTEPLAGVFQYLGHTVGSLLAAWLLLLIGQRRLLDDWYGPEAVAQARAWQPQTTERVAFWIAVLCGAVGGLAWALLGDWVERIHRTAAGLFAGAVVGSLLIMASSGTAVRRLPSPERGFHTPSRGR